MNKSVLFSVIAIVIMNGCSTVSQESVFRSMNETTKQQESGELNWIKNESDAREIEQRVHGLLSQPLDERSAVRIALINNRSLQQSYEKIGIAQSELVQAGLMSNPLLGYSVGRGGGMTASTMSVEFAFLDLLWIPLRKELAALALEEAKYSVGDEVLRTVKETKIRYTQLRVAYEVMKLYEEMLSSYEASTQLAMRQYTAGNLSKRDYLKIQEEYAHARVEAIQAKGEYASAREELNRMMGVYAKQTEYRLSAESWELATLPQSAQSLEKNAIIHRLDMVAAQKRVEYAAKEAGYTQNTRLLSEVALEAQSEKRTDEDRFNTFGIKIPIPLFDTGEGKINMVGAKYNQSVHHLYETAVTIRSEVRENYAKFHYAYDVAREYRDTIIVSNQQILKETQLFYNGMLDGIYELLRDQRALTQAKIDGWKALGEYQKARAELTYTVGYDLSGSKDNNATDQ